MNVTACLVTRGDLNLTRIHGEITKAGITDVQIWNNALEQDAGVYGRYRAIEQAPHPVVFVQDDDCVVPATTILALVAAHEPGRIVCNMPERFHAHYPDSALIGFGAVFDRDLPALAFARYSDHFRDYRGRTKDFTSRPDVIFTALTPCTVVDLPVLILPEAYAADRMYRQKGHVRDRHRVLQYARRARA